MALTKVTNSMLNSAPASVLDYGADPTGTADSSAAIQAAIQANNNVCIPAGTYRCDNPILIESTYTNRKYVTMTAATKLVRMSAHSSSSDPVIELLGNYGHFDGGFGELMSENDSPRGVAALGQRDTNTLSTGNGLFWSFTDCDVRCKTYVTAPVEGATIGIYVPSAQPFKGSNYANYYGTVSNVRVFSASISYHLTDSVNAHTFVNCSVEFFWHYAWKLNGAYGNSFYGGFVNGCYQNGGYVFYFGNKLYPSAPFAPSHQSNNNNVFGIATELYTTGNYGVYFPAGVGGFDSTHNFVQFSWNSVGNPVTDLTSGIGNTIFDGNTTFYLGENLTTPNNTVSGRGLLRVGTTSYVNNHAIARSVPSGSATLVVENLTSTATGSFVAELVWNAPTIGYNSSILSAYHKPTTTTVFKVLDNGNVQNTNNSYGAISDAKLKDVIGLVGSQWDDVKFLASKLTKYSLKADPDKQPQLGWIAQEIETQCPGLVYETPDVKRVETIGADGSSEITYEPTGETTKNVRYSVAELKAFKALGEALERIEKLEAALAKMQSA